MASRSGVQCPKCGLDAVTCEYWDSGHALLWVDNFRHHCANPECDYRAEHLDDYAGQVGYEGDWPFCPFCGRKATDGSEGEPPPRARPVAPDWLTWNGGAVPTIAGLIAEHGTFGDLPVLADALEEAGCTDPVILDHCRAPSGHPPGQCWVVELLLGRL